MSTATPSQPQQDHRAADVLRLLQTTFPRDWEKHLRNLPSRSLPLAEPAEFTDQVFWRVKQIGIKDPATWLVTHRTLMEAPTAPLVPVEPEAYPVGAVASPIEPTRPHTCAAAADGEFIKKKNRRPSQTRKVVAFNLGQWMLSATPEINDSVIDVQLCSLKQARFDNRQISAQDRLVTDLAALTCPVQLIWGGRDVLTFPSIRTRLDRCLAVRPDLEAGILPVGGHWVQYECADEVNELLTRFHAPNSARKSGWQ